jgi:hypothetical protein
MKTYVRRQNGMQPETLSVNTTIKLFETYPVCHLKDTLLSSVKPAAGLAGWLLL